MDPTLVLNALERTLVPTNEVRAEAERALTQFATQPGLGFALLQILANVSIASQMRQLAGVLLRKHLMNNWVHYEDDEVIEDTDDFVRTDVNFETGQVEKTVIKTTLSAEHQAFLDMKKSLSPIEIPDAEKLEIRAGLAPLLVDSHSEIRNSVCNIIAFIANHDIDSWPELVPSLINALASPDSLLVVGALRCMTLLTEECSASAFSSLVGKLFEVLVLISSPKSPMSPAIKAGAIRLYSEVISSYTIIEDPQDKVFEKKYGSMLLPTLSGIMGICSHVLDQPLPASLSSFSAVESAFEVRAEAINLFVTLIAYFPKMMRPHLITLTDIIERSVTATLPFFDVHVVANRYNIPSGVFSEHPLAGLPQIFSNALAFYGILVDSPKGAGKHLRLRLNGCYRLIASLMQLTEADCEDLREDVGQFASLENEVSEYDGSSMKTTVLRKQAIILVCQTLEAWPRSAGDAVAVSVDWLYHNALSLAASGNPLWWRSLESAAMLTGQLLTDTNAFVKQTGLPLKKILENIIFPSLNATQQTFNGSSNASFMNSGTLDITSEELCFLRARGAWLIGVICVPITSGATAALAHFSKFFKEATSNKKANVNMENPGKVVAESRAYLSQLLPLLMECLSTRAVSLVQVSSAISIRLAGIGLADLDLSFTELAVLCTALTQSTGQAPQLPFSVEPLLGPIFSPLLQGLCSQIVSGEAGDALHSAVESLVWATQAAASWASASNEMVATYGENVQSYMNSLNSRGLSILSTMMATASPVSDAILRCWGSNFSDPIIAEGTVDIIKALTAISSCSASVTSNVLPIVMDILNRPSAEVPAGVRMISLELVSVVLRNSAPGWSSLPTDVYSTSAISQVPAHVTPLLSLSSVVSTINEPFTFRHAPGANTFNGQEVVERLLPIVLNVGLTTSIDESWLIQGSCALSSTILAIYGPIIAGNSQYFPLAKEAANLATRLLLAKESEMSETAIAPVARLLTQLIVNLGATSVLDDATKGNLLNLALTRIINSQAHTLTVALLLFFSRFIIQNPETMLGLLASRGNVTKVVDRMVEKLVKSKKGPSKKKMVTVKDTIEVPAIQAFANVMFTCAPDFHSAYACKVIFTAMARIICDQQWFTALSLVVVDGPEPIDTSAPLMTRGKKARNPPKSQKNSIPAIPAFIGAFGDAVARAIENKNHVPNDSNELGLFEESDDDNDAGEYNDDEIELPQKSGKSGKSIFADADEFESGTMNLSDMLDFEQLDGDEAGYDRFGDQEDFPEFVYDLLDQVELADLGVSVLQSLPQELLVQSSPHLNSEQQESIQKILQIARV